MSRRWIRSLSRRWLGVQGTTRREPIRLNALRLEDRTVPSLASPPTQFLATSGTLRAITNPDLNSDGKRDLAVLGSDGSFTVALNDGNNGWTAVTTSQLGRSDVWGMSFGLLDADLFTDCVIQTGDGVMIGRGDGQGRLTNWRTQTLGAAGSFAGPVGSRVDPAIGYLGNDPFADVVTVAPATNEVVVLRGDGTGEFAPAVRYASGGVGPVTAWVGQFIGEGVNDVAVGHRDGTLTVFEGAADGSLIRSATTVSGLGTITGLSAADVNGDGELDLVVSGTDRVTILVNRHDPAPTPAIHNGDFSQGLTAWTTTSGIVGAGGGYAEFREDPSALLSSIRQTFTVPVGARELVFDLTNYGLETATGIPDAFEASLLGADNRPLLTTFRSDASSFFHLNPDKTVGLADGVTFDGWRVTVDLSALPVGQSATLVFHLAGQTGGRSSVIGIDNVAVTVAAVHDDGFDVVPLSGPFVAATGVGTGDVDGDGRSDVVVADGNRFLVFNRTAAGSYTREETAVVGATAVSIAPLTAGDGIADVSVLVAGGVRSPLVRRIGSPLDQAPRLTTLPDVSGTEGTGVIASATFADADGGGPYTSTIDWGDGNSSTGAVAFANGQGTITGTHIYPDNGAYRVRVTVRSANGGPIDFRDMTATIANANPVLATADVTTEVGRDTELTLGTFTDLGFSATDLRTRETFLARVDWGDGSTLRPFARLAVTDGATGIATAGSVFGSHRYVNAGVYSVTVTLTDDDGGETVRTLVMTVRPPTTDTGVWWVPGVAGTSVQAQFDYLPSDTAYRNELAYFLVDDALGRIGTLLPGDAGYAAAAIARLSDPPLFTQSDRSGAATYRTFAAGQFVAFAVIKDGALASLRTNNPTGLLANDPLVWLSTAAANADGGYQHFHRTDRDGGWVEYASEDMTNGGDFDFNDLVFRVGPVRPGPVVQSIGAVSGAEGAAVQFSATVNSPTGATGLTASVAWGDGASQAVPIIVQNGRQTVSANHIYADNGAYTVTLTVSDTSGRSVNRTSTATITNVPPTFTSRANLIAAPRQSLVLPVGTFTDPGFNSASAGTAETFTATVDWGDGTGSQPATVTATNGAAGTLTTGTVQGGHTYVALGTYTATVRIRDDDGGEVTGTFQVSVVATAPTVAAFTPPSGSEGSLFTLAATFTDPDPEDGFTARIDWGDGVQTDGAVSFANGQGTVGGTHVYADNGTYTISVRVTDRYGLTGVRSAGRTVTNTAPTLTAAASQIGTAGQPLAMALGSFTDPGFTSAIAGTLETFTATVNWGDGSGTQAATVSTVNGSAGVLTTGTVTGTHSYAAAGTYTVTAVVTDDDGGTSSRTLAVTIATGASSTKFFVVDQSAHTTFRYGATGQALGSESLGTSGNRSPRGVAANAAGDTYWVVTTNRSILVYTASGTRIGDWSASGLNQPQDITVSGNDLWVVDDSKDRVSLFAGAATRRSGDQAATSSFALNASNKDATGLVTDGQTIWVTDRHGNTERVFVYSLSGSYLGQWNLDAANDDPSGITLDPTGQSADLWVVDRQDATVYRYTGAKSRRSGSQTAADSFALASGNQHPEGIADPPPTGWFPADPTPTPHTPSPADPTGARDVSPFVSVAYRTAYFNWESGELRADTRLTNSGTTSLHGPVFAVYDRLSNGAQLAAPDGAFAGSGYVVYQSELGAGGLAAGATSSAVTVRFAPGNHRFDAGVTLLAAGNRSPLFTSTPPTALGVGQALSYTAVATDLDGDPVTYSVLVGPSGLQIDPTSGVVTWTPTAADIGANNITVQASDGRGGVAEQTFRLVVQSANRPPVIRSTPSNTGLLVGQTFDYTLDAIDPDGDPLTYSVISGPPGLQLSADGRITWTAPVTGTIPVAVQVTDGHGGTAAQSFAVTVTSGTGGAIHGVKFRYFDGEGGAPLVGPNLVTNGDFNLGDTGFQTELISNPDLFPEGRYTIGVNPASHHPAAGSFGDHTTGTGTMMIVNGSVNGSVTVWRQQVAVQAGQAYAFSLWAASWYPSSPARIHVEVNGVQVGPDLSLSSNTGLWKQFAVTWLSGTDTVADVRIVNLETAAAGNDFVIDDISLGVPGVPNWTVYLDQNGNNKLDLGERSTTTAADGSYQFAGLAAGGYRVNEVPQGGWVQVEPAGRTQVVSLPDGSTVAGVNFGNRRITPTANRPPAFAPVGPQSATVGQFFRLDPLATDPDGEPLIYELIGAPAGATIDAFTGSITWVPTPDQTGPAPLAIRARDGFGATADLTVTVTVNPAANGFAITSTPPRLIDIGRPYLYPVATTAAVAQPATFSLDSTPAGMSIDPISGLVTWATPELGSFRVTVSAADRAGNVAYQSYLLSVRPANEPPVLLLPGNAQLAAGGQYRGLARATDSADGFAFSVVSGPAGLTVDPQTGVVLWTTPPIGSGPYSVTLRATDDRGATADGTYIITLIPDLTKPDVTVTANPQRVNAGEPVTVRVSALDDGRVVGRTLFANGVAVVLDANGVGTYTPSAPGVVRFAATATDAAGNVGAASTSLSVSDPTDTTAPTVTFTSPLDGSIISYRTTLVGTVTDANLVGYTVELSRFGSYQWRTIATGTAPVVNGPLAMIDPTLLDSDMYTVRVTATDVNGLQTSQELSFDLTGQAKVGNFRQEFIDLQIPLAGVPITVKRVYDSLQADQSGDFGFGWSLGVGYDPRVRETRPVNDPGERVLGMFAATAFKAGTRVYVNTPDGRRVGFTFEPKPYSGILGLLGAGTGGMYQASFRADPGVFETLEGEYDGSAAFRLPLIKYGDSFYTAGISVAYNPLGYRLTTKDGVTYHFGQFDGLKSITDRNDVKLTFARNGITSSLGTSIAFARDGQGRITSITDPNGGTLQYRYDTNGNLLGAKNQVGLEEQYAYESVERPHFLTTVTSVCGCYPSARLEYDADGRLVRETNALGESMTSSYDIPGFRETFTDGLNRATTLTYDPRGNVTAKIDPLGREWRSTYDANDNEISMVDPRGVTTSKQYDARGNVIQATDGGGFVTTVGYNSLNLPISMTDARSNNSTVFYDPQGRLISTTDPTGATTTTTYDAIGRNLVSVDASGRTTTFDYRFDFTTPLRTVYADGSATFKTINWLDQTVSEFNTLGNPQTTVYDDAGRTLSAHTPQGNSTTFGYDTNGRLERMVDALGNITRYEYDNAGRKTAEVTANGRRTWIYDVAGQLIRRIDRNGRESRFEIDGVGRLTKESWYASSLATVPNDSLLYGYDLANNLTSIVDGDSKVERSYDARNLLTTEKQYGTDAVPRTILSYGYNPNANVLSVSDQTGTAVVSTYTTRNQLATRAWTVVSGGSLGTTFTYDAAGRVIQQSRTAGGVLAGQTQRSFDSVGNLSRLTHSGAAGQLFADTRYLFDGTVRLIGEQRLDQNVSYGYDADWQLTGADYTGQADENRAYDALGNLAGATVGPHNRLLADATFNYVYDDEGNLTRKIERATGEVTNSVFDHHNRLTHVTRQSAGGVLLSDVGYRYDGFGRLIERNENGVLQRTVYDGWNAWADLTAANAVSARYLLGDGADELIARWRAADGFAWYLTDHQGTVRELINGAGTAVVNAIQYSAFGEILSQTNSTAGDRFAFTGREWEASAGLYYYRARFYDPGTGRFISQDPIGFESGDANEYRYAFNTPQQFTDPYGLAVFTEEAALEKAAVARANIVRCLGRAALSNFAETGVYIILSVAGSTIPTLPGYTKPPTNAYVGSTARTVLLRVGEHQSRGRVGQSIITIPIRLAPHIANNPSALRTAEQLVINAFGGKGDLANIRNAKRTVRC